MASSSSHPPDQPGPAGPDGARPPLDGKQLQQAITTRPGLPLLSSQPDAPAAAPRRHPPLVYWPVIRLAAAAAAGSVLVAVLALKLYPPPGGDAETRRRGDTEMRGQRVTVTQGQGDAGTRGHGDREKEMVAVVPRPRVSPSPRLPVPASPRPRVPASLPPDAAVEARLRLGEKELRDQLRRVPELRLFSDADMQAVRQYQAKSERQVARGTLPGVVDYICNACLHQNLRRAGTAAGLPLAAGPRAAVAAAPTAQALSRQLRGLGFVSIPGQPTTVLFPSGRVAAVRGTGIRAGSPPEKVAAFEEWCTAERLRKYRGVLPVLAHVLEAEGEAVRLRLVQELAREHDPSAVAVLAGRAMADLSPRVRQAAVATLKAFPPEQYEPYLLQGLRYPWPAVAGHAAAALVQLDARAAVPKLVELLTLPDPARPARGRKAGGWVVRELVRLNHLRNCLLCHAASAGPSDGLLRAPVPTPGRPLPVAAAGHPAGDFVRADFVFLRPDFSADLPAGADGPWPAEQRFDFVVRTVRLPADALPVLKTAGDYPQRQAVRYALRRLTGQDGGDSLARWRQIAAATAQAGPVRPAR